MVLTFGFGSVIKYSTMATQRPNLLLPPFFVSVLPSVLVGVLAINQRELVFHLNSGSASQKLHDYNL